MFSFDFPVLIQPATSGFIVRLCGMDGRPMPNERPVVCATLEDVFALLRERLTPPTR